MGPTPLQKREESRKKRTKVKREEEDLSEMGHEDGTGYQQQPDAHKLCANGCGFFGTAATLNLCSKCYRDHRIKEEQSASVKAAMEKSLNPNISSNQSTTATSASQPQLIVSPSSIDSTSSSSSSSGNLGEPSAKSVSGVKNRCCSCNKRVGLTGFTCKCGSTYCSAHRYPEEHSCSFDFKSIGRDTIAKANPVVKAEKLQKL